MLHSNGKKQIFFGYSPLTIIRMGNILDVVNVFSSDGENIGRVTTLGYGRNMKRSRGNCGILFQTYTVNFSVKSGGNTMGKGEGGRGEGFSNSTASSAVFHHTPKAQPI